MGMEIARALGFPETVLARASKYLTGAGHELSDAIARLTTEREKARGEAESAAMARREAESVRARLSAERERAKEEESRILAAMRQKVRDELRKAEGMLRAVTEELRKEKKIETVRKAQAVIREWKEKDKAEEDPVVRAMISRTAPLFPGTVLFQGRKVFLLSVRKEGEIASAPATEDREIEVRVGEMKIRVPREQVRIFPGTPAGPPEGKVPKAPRRGEEPSPALYLQTPENTLDLRGRFVEEALPEVDAFLDRLSLAEAPHAFIIHGHGTGALKTAVRGHLRGSPYAKRVFPAPREQGGDGVTIVLIR